MYVVVCILVVVCGTAFAEIDKILVNTENWTSSTPDSVDTSNSGTPTSSSSSRWTSNNVIVFGSTSQENGDTENWTNGSSTLDSDTPTASEASSSYTFSTVGIVPFEDSTISTTTSEDFCLYEITNLTVTPSSFNATITWDPPDCSIYEYNIFLDGEPYINTTETTLVLEDLEVCENYKISVIAVTETAQGNATEETFKTPAPIPFGHAIENFTISELDNSLNITWSPPTKFEKCIIDYSFSWWDDNGKTNYDITSEPFAELRPIIGCLNYTFQVIPRTSTGEGTNHRDQYTSMPKIPNPPQNIEVMMSVNRRNASITWETDNEETNRCQMQQIVLNCSASKENNSDLNWIEWSKVQVLEIESTSSNYRYKMVIDELSPWTNYTCEAISVNIAGNSSETQVLISTLKDVPSAPHAVILTDVGPYSFNVTWTEPEIVPGVMEGYVVVIESETFYPTPDNCENNTDSDKYDLTYPNSSLLYTKAKPYHKYSVKVYAVDDVGPGPETSNATITEQTEPEPVSNLNLSITHSKTETYDTTATLGFRPPCNINGVFSRYVVTYKGQRNNYNDYDNTTTIDTINPEILNFTLLPDRQYSLHVTVFTDKFNATIDTQFQSPSGVPKLEGNFTAPVTIDSVQAKFKFSKKTFSDINGDILYYSLIVFTNNENGEDFGFWDGVEWPISPGGKQVTDNLWNPFADAVEEVEVIIGNENGCSEEGKCNTKLSHDTEYWLVVRALTNTTYKDSPPLSFKTDALAGINLALILGLVFGILAIIIISVFLAILWRRRRRQNPIIEQIEEKITAPESIPCKKYLTYYESLKENYSIVKSQFTSLELQSKDLGSTSFALYPENKRKNRYTNILPYNETRVKFKIDEDDEMSSDFINASYIKGYSGKIEYIATQGPLQSTCRDFWKMVIQENVTIIVMVSQFIEQSKEKCYQYFPNNHQNVSFDDINITCCTELHFGTYCIRTLQVQKDNEQRDITHMQFLEWPDFGVPEGTDKMLQFCKQLREKITSEEGLTAVHCSAGVGRTGTLITLDILLQAIYDQKDINIYKTVLDLRQQRTNMVQTEKQYMFIHTCIRDYLDSPSGLINDPPTEQIYENLNIIKSTMKENLIGTEIESAL